MNELLKFILGIAESKKKVQKPSPEMENHLLSILVFYHSIERNIYPLLIFFRWFLTCSSCSHKSHGLQYIDESGPDDVYLKNWASTSADKKSLSANVWQREQIWDLLYEFFFLSKNPGTSREGVPYNPLLRGESFYFWDLPWLENRAYLIRVMDTPFQSGRTGWEKHSTERKLDLGFVILGFSVWCAFWGGRKWKTAPGLDKMDWNKIEVLWNE